MASTSSTSNQSMASPSPKKKKTEMLKDAIESNVEDLDAKLTSALYYINKGEIKKGTEVLEKSLRIIKSSHAKYTFLSKEINLELIATKQDNDLLRRREKHLSEEIVSLKKKVSQFKKFITFDDYFEDDSLTSSQGTEEPQGSQDLLQASQTSSQGTEDPQQSEGSQDLLQASQTSSQGTEVPQ